MKYQYLITHDYGMGAVWGVISARSEQEVLQKYPQVQIVTMRPEWMSDEVYADVVLKNSFDIDQSPHGWLAELKK
jgi:hypothetical protein